MARQDLDIDALLHELSMQLRRKVVKSLLAGNDTCCFTVEQYVTAWQQIVDKGKPPLPLGWPGLAVRHLGSLPHQVREVRPGVWAAIGTAPLAVIEDDGEPD